MIISNLIGQYIKIEETWGIAEEQAKNLIAERLIVVAAVHDPQTGWGFVVAGVDGRDHGVLRQISLTNCQLRVIASERDDLRELGQAAIEWRKYVTLVAADPHTRAFLDKIDRIKP